jgi:hypothetical protein
MTSPLFWTVSPLKTRASNLQALASDVRSAVGRPARMTCGLVAAAIRGTHLTPEVFAPPVSTAGLQRNAFLVPAGRRIPIGMRNNIDFLTR